MPVNLITVNTTQGCKRHDYRNLVERSQSQQVIRNQPSAETVYEKRGRTVNTDLQTAALFQLWHILITLLINSTVGVYYSVSMREWLNLRKNCSFCLLFFLFCLVFWFFLCFFLWCRNDKDRTGWKLVTFPGNASLWPSVGSERGITYCICHTAFTAVWQMQ